MRENCTFRLSGGRRRALQWAPPPTRQAAARHFGADEFGRKGFAPRDVLHLAGDYTPPRIVHLRADCVVLAFGYPFCMHGIPLVVGYG
jgi:hypothetical protein